MNKTGWIVAGVVLVAAVLAVYTLLAHRPSIQRMSVRTESGSGNASVGANGASSIVAYTDKGFSPSPLTVAVGTTVTWSNQSSHKLWVESIGAGEDCSNPAHASLNECRAIAAGGSYSYTFTAPGTVTYFNHERSTDRGNIVIVASGAAGPINPNAIPE